MRKRLVIVSSIIVFSALAVAATVDAQQLPAGVKPAQNVPVELQIVVSRYQGDKRISSLPYLLSLKTSPNASAFRTGGLGAQLRLGSRVPIRSQVVTPAADGKPATTSYTIRYESVGTNIDAGATALEDGRFEITLTVEESSVITDPADAKSSVDGNPVFRSYQSTNTFFVKDAPTTQFTAATDRVSGEVVRVEVKLTVVK